MSNSAYAFASHISYIFVYIYQNNCISIHYLVRGNFINIMDRIKNDMARFSLIAAILLTISCVFILIGIILIIVKNSKIEGAVHERAEIIQRKEIDYTNCENYYVRSKNKTTCLEYTTGINNTCTCFVNFKLDSDLSGNVTIYYRLNNFEITPAVKYSRDNEQLSGILSNAPSNDCAPAVFDENHRPIAPCGLLADLMFTDDFISLARRDNNDTSEFVTRVHTGMISDDDKAPFKNAEGDLRSALQNFSKPKNWRKNVWELDPLDTSNNGFQNERFIGWMNTDWIEKPAWRVNASGIFANGLPSGKYVFKIIWNYPSSLYSGQRTIILKSKRIEFITATENSTLLIAGVVLILLGFLIIVCVALVHKYGEKFRWKIELSQQLNTNITPQISNNQASENVQLTPKEDD